MNEAKNLECCGNCKHPFCDPQGIWRCKLPNMINYIDNFAGKCESWQFDNIKAEDRFTIRINWRIE